MIDPLDGLLDESDEEAADTTVDEHEDERAEDFATVEGANDPALSSIGLGSFAAMARGWIGVNMDRRTELAVPAPTPRRRTVPRKTLT